MYALLSLFIIAWLIVIMKLLNNVKQDSEIREINRMYIEKKINNLNDKVDEIRRRKGETEGPKTG
jgi:hypothetical protein